MVNKKLRNYGKSKFVEDLEDENSLENYEENVQEKYEIAQRELVTQSVDFSIRTLAQMVDNEQIDINPKYQRRLRWDDKRQSKLVESLLMNVPIPPLFFAEESYGKYSVIDGKQRLKTIADLFDDKLTLQGLEVFYELNGSKFSNLPNELQSVLRMRPTIRCVIVQRQSHPEIKFAVFERLNTGGVKLNDQEIRNSAYRGALNDLIIELSEYQQFRDMLRVKDPETSQIVQYMRDCELVLRFFALKDNWIEFSGSMKRTLNLFMEDNRKIKHNSIEELKSDFLETLDTVSEIFGEHAFLRWNNKTENWSKHVLASVYDAQMFACYNMPKVWENPLHYEEFIERYIELFTSDDDFVDSIVGQTNTPAKLKYRVSQVLDLFHEMLR